MIANIKLTTNHEVFRRLNEGKPLDRIIIQSFSVHIISNEKNPGDYIQ